MPEVEDIALQPGSRTWQLAIRIAAQLIVDCGHSRGAPLRRIADSLGWSVAPRQRPDGTNRGSRAGEAVSHAVRALATLELVERDGADVRALDVGDLAAWLADELDEHVHLLVGEQTVKEGR